MKKTKRIISSISDVITNSSTQVFLIDVDQKFLDLYNSNDYISSEVILVRNKEDILRLLKVDNSCEIYRFLYGILPYGFVSEYSKDDVWNQLNEGGRTDEEIIDFLWPIIQKEIPEGGLAYYTYEDDCRYSTTANILYENGYYSDRDS